jgi:dethiobiotin synthetase
MGGGVLVTGTDTGVGKTFVACGSRFGTSLRVGVMKPAETGCAERDGELFPEDAVRLKEASGCDAPLDKISLYQLREPLAPSIAAERTEVKIDIDRLMDVYHEISSGHDITLVEGAGGLMGRFCQLPMLISRVSQAALSLSRRTGSVRSTTWCSRWNTRAARGCGCWVMC